MLIDYLDAFRKRPDDLLFTTLRSERQLAESDLRKLARVLARRGGIGRRVFPHLLRHSLATNLLNRGASLMMIKEQLGHAFIDSTMVYVTSMPFRARSEYDFSSRLTCSAPPRAGSTAIGRPFPRRSALSGLDKRFYDFFL